MDDETKQDILKACEEHPDWTWQMIARLFPGIQPTKIYEIYMANLFRVS